MSSRKLAAVHLPVLLFACIAPAAFAASTSLTQDGTGTLAEEAEALLRGEALNPLDVELVAGGPVSGSQGAYSVPLRLQVPWDRLQLEEDGNELRGELRLVIASRDRKGHDELAREFLVPVRVTKVELEDAVEPVFTYDLTVELGPGKHLVALSLHDELASVTSFAKYSLRVLKPSRQVDMRYALPQRTPLGGLTLYPSSISQ